MGVEPPGGIYIHWYAAQLARDATGNWIALGDRSQGPSGAGYVVENRIVISRTLPEEFQNLNVVRLAAFFIALQNTLASLSRNHRDNPRVVLLSPGPKSSRYFEDVYLARYLGYTLVEGGDLTVRGDGVYLKTLGGLLSVDVIMRRMGDGRCDPLELRPDSPGGIPGLMQVVRDGQVVVANALGSGFPRSTDVAGLSASCLPIYAGRGTEASVCANVVVRSARRFEICRSSSRSTGRSSMPSGTITSRFTSAPTWITISERSCLPSFVPNRRSTLRRNRWSVQQLPVWNGGRLQPWHVTASGLCGCQRW